jgi:hypothetical protein
MLDMEPKHIAFIGHNAVLSNSSVVVDTFAEWYLLGLGDRLVLNRWVGFRATAARADAPACAL